MPSGAKKRKAAKKKLHDTISHHSQGSDGGEETALKSYAGDSKYAETGQEGNPPKSYNGDTHKDHKSSSSSSSSNSSSDDDEVDIEKDKSSVVDIGDEKVESDAIVPDTVSDENGIGAEVVEADIDETIPVEETLKEVVSSNSMNDSELNQISNEVSSPSILKENVAFEAPVVDNASGKSSISTNNHGLHQNGMPLISSAPLPSRRTSWLNCCGLFEVISGGSSR